MDSYGLLGDALTYQAIIQSAMHNSKRIRGTALEMG